MVVEVKAPDLSLLGLTEEDEGVIESYADLFQNCCNCEFFCIKGFLFKITSLMILTIKV